MPYAEGTLSGRILAGGNERLAILREGDRVEDSQPRMEREKFTSGMPVPQLDEPNRDEPIRNDGTA